jgi:hypothetical protein
VAEVDRQVISGSGINGEVLGVRLTPGISTVAASAVTIQGVYSAIANAVQLVHTTQFPPPEVIVMPRRWGGFLSLPDNQDRPLSTRRLACRTGAFCRKCLTGGI